MAAQESKQSRREPNFSEEEKLCLLSFVQQHKTKLLGKAGRPGHGDDKVEERKAKYWKMCAGAIKANGGRDRDWKKVRKQWFDLKDKAKKLKSEMSVTGGGPKPASSRSMEMAMEVVAREALEGIRGRTTEVDPLGHASVEMSQDSSQDSETPALPPSSSSPTLASTSATASTATSSSSTTTPSSSSTTPSETGSLVALQQQVNLLQSQVEMLGNQPSSLQRATEIRQLKFQEELLKLEKKKVDLLCQAVETQKKMLVALESMGAQALLSSMAEQ